MPYPTDLTDAQWRRIAQLVPAPKPGGRPAKYPRRGVVNAIPYQARGGCAWRALPHDLPPYRIAFHSFRPWQRGGTWDRLHDRLRADARRAAGRKPRPSVAILGGRSVQATGQGGPRGPARGRKVVGRKRLGAVDTLGLPWALVGVPASTQDRHGGLPLVERLRAAVRYIQVAWGDTHFDAALRHA